MGLMPLQALSTWSRTSDCSSESPKFIFDNERNSSCRSMIHLSFHLSFLTLSLTCAMISSREVPGPYSPVIPSFRSLGLSSSGIIPPPTTSISPPPIFSSSFFTLGKAVMWAPFKRDNATTSTSSSTAIRATCSGVGSRPLYITSIPASRKARARTRIPRSCPSRPGFATKTLIFRSLEGFFLIDKGRDNRRLEKCYSRRVASDEDRLPPLPERAPPHLDYLA